jgi:selenide,water dikinase
MGPEALAQVLRPLAGMVPPERRADLLVGLAEGDDAAVYKLNDSTALVFTADFFLRWWMILLPSGKSRG